MGSRRKAFSGIVELSFHVNGKSIDIDPANIIYMMVEDDYVNNVLPIIYISMSINNTLYNNIMEYQNSGKFFLNVKDNNVLSVVSLNKNIMAGAFNYVPSTTNPNYMVDLRASDNQNYDDAYRTITVGLVSDVMTAELRRSFNGVFENIDTHTLITKALEGMKTVVQIPAYSEVYPQIMIPPTTSRYKLIEYIFDKDPYYDTNFRFFMDFDKTYLLAADGQAGSMGDDVIIDVRQVTDEEAMFDGIESRNGANYMYVNASDSNITINKAISQVANTVVAYDDELPVAQIFQIDNSGDKVSMIPKQTTSAMGAMSDADRRVYVRTHAGNLYKNAYENSGITLEVVKQNVDGSDFTPDKNYNVRYYADNSKYTGPWILIYKRVMYKSAAGIFNVTCNLGLQKLTNISQYGGYNWGDKSQAVSTSALKSTTAGLFNTANIRRR